MKPDKTSPDQAVRIQAESRTFLADLQTPVGIYLKVRDLFPESALLESSDYHTSENSYSFIGVEPIARFALQRDTITEQYPDGRVQQFAVDPAHPLSERMNRFSPASTYRETRDASTDCSVTRLMTVYPISRV